MATQHGAVNDRPHSFVLADLFDVESMSLEVPEHVYESDPTLEWVTCSTCEGEKWLEHNGNGWTSALFSDSRQAYAHRHLNSSFKVCGRCNGVGEVLDSPTEKNQKGVTIGSKNSKDLVTRVFRNETDTPTVDELIARVEYLLAAHHADKGLMQDVLQRRR